MSTAGGKGPGKAVPGGKGVAAEGEAPPAFPGRTENIRPTVAQAESYGLVAPDLQRRANAVSRCGRRDTVDAALCIGFFVSRK